MNIASASRSVGASLIAAVAAAAIVTPAANAQTWIRDIESTHLQVNGLTVRDDGMIAIARNNLSGGGITIFTPGGSMAGSFDLDADDGSETIVNDAVFLDDGTLALCGSAGNYPWVSAINPDNGQAAWNTVLTSGSNEGDLSRMTVNELGHVVVQGQIVEAGKNVPFLAAVRPEANGATAYRRVFGTDMSSSLIAAQNGDLLMASHSGNVTVTRTSNFANIKWRKHYDGEFWDTIPSLVETTSGDIMSIGLVRNDVSNFDFCAFKMTADGDVIWRRTYYSFPSLVFGVVPEVTAAIPMADGGLVAAVGQPGPDGKRDAALLRLDADGNIIWLQPFGRAGVNDLAVGVEQTPDGGFVVAVQVEGGGLRVVRLDAEGKAGDCAISTMFTDDYPVEPVTTISEDFAYTNYGMLWGDVTVSPLLHGALVTYTCGEPCTVTGDTYGHGTQGSGDLAPELSATDGVCLGYTPQLEVSDAVGGAAGLIFYGVDAGSTPALGGTFLIDPTNFMSFPVVLDGPEGASGAGTASFQLGTDLTPFIGITLHFQGLFLDANGPTGKTLTNGVTFAIQ